MDASTHIPIYVLTGFLGSGKTTLLNALLADGAVPTAVIVNEFGDIAIDHDLVATTTDTAKVTTTGCICCTPGSDIVATLITLAETADSTGLPAFERVVVETTGLADPAPIINQLLSLGGQTGDRTYRLAGVITLVDAVCGLATIDSRFECLKQVAFADRIVLTKTDLVSPDAPTRIETIRQRLRLINPTALLLDTAQSGTAPSAIFTPRPYAPQSLGEGVEEWLALERLLARSPVPSHQAPGSPDRHAGISTRSFVLEAPVAQREFVGFLELLRQSAGPRLLRLKGLVALADDPDRPMIVHLVQGIFHPPVRLDAWPSADRRTRLVVISEGIDASALDRLFASLAAPRRDGKRLLSAFQAIAVAAAVAGAIGATALVAQAQPQTRPFNYSTAPISIERTFP